MTGLFLRMQFTSKLFFAVVTINVASILISSGLAYPYSWRGAAWSGHGGHS